MFDFGLTKDDLKRIAWTFLQAALGFVFVYATGWAKGLPWEWKAVLIGAAGAGWSAIKNYVLSDRSELK